MPADHFHLNFPNIGCIGVTFSEEELQPIKDEINKIKSNFEAAKKTSHANAGNIKKEFDLVNCKDTILSLVSPILLKYPTIFDFGDATKTKLKLTSLWVNFQEKYEFLSTHTHKGKFSFALWIQVPYTMEEEIEFSSGSNKTTILPATFNFHYTDALGKIRPWTIPVDKTFENKMVLFPGELNHSVHPFYTSNDYRIVVSGNLEYDD